METSFKNKYAEFYLSDGILYFNYSKGVRLDLKAAETVVFDRLHFQEEKAYPILCDTRGIQDTEKAARDFLANEGSLLAKAVAFIVNPNVTGAIIEFYLKTSKPFVPTEVFTDKYEALKYLERYK